MMIDKNISPISYPRKKEVYLTPFKINLNKINGKKKENQNIIKEQTIIKKTKIQLNSINTLSSSFTNFFPREEVFLSQEPDQKKQKTIEMQSKDQNINENQKNTLVQKSYSSDMKKQSSNPNVKKKATNNTDSLFNKNDFGNTSKRFGIKITDIKKKYPNFSLPTTNGLSGGTKLRSNNPWVSSDGDLLSHFRPRVSHFILDQRNMNNWNNSNWSFTKNEISNNKKNINETPNMSKNQNGKNIKNNISTFSNRSHNQENLNNIQLKRSPYSKETPQFNINKSYQDFSNTPYNQFNSPKIFNNPQKTESSKIESGNGLLNNGMSKMSMGGRIRSFGNYQNLNSYRIPNSRIKGKKNQLTTQSYTHINLNVSGKKEYYNDLTHYNQQYRINNQNRQQNKNKSQQNLFGYIQNQNHKQNLNLKLNQDHIEFPNQNKNKKLIGYESYPSLLEQFRENPEAFNSVPLSELFNELIVFCTDQLGARFIQLKLDNSSANEKIAFWSIISTKVEYLIKNVFGNYVIQKYLEVGLPEHIEEIIKSIKGRVYHLSRDIYSCRVVQKAFEVAKYEDKVDMVNEIYEKSILLVKDQNGNHVIQKCLQCLTDELRSKIVLNLVDHIVQLSFHGFGCRVIQQLLKYYRGEYFDNIVDKLLRSVPNLIMNQSGNYVVQNLLEFCTKSEQKIPIFQMVNYRFIELSTHKFASNVVEKCIIFGTPEEHTIITNLLSANNFKFLKILLNDRFGNYVVQRLIGTFNKYQKNHVLNYLLNCYNEWKNFAYGKHILKKLNSVGFYF
ncbi:mateRNAl protein pumilio [Anaeramoeba flamelloides]|uniref:MateRNAl protein pumilio n=1 Tax=Anaeramoeba flamelloides TaxID=1746091 RepID=A0AAV7YGX0_9EUKA|nr:mateRNAl protein pumilio [Anaeramoeba flamelloides]